MKRFTPQLLLRLGLAFIFGYAAIELVINPNSLIEFTPEFVTQILPVYIFLALFGMYHVVLCLWFLWGEKLLIPSLLAAATMAGIVVFNLDLFVIVFRDVAIMFMALALASMSYDRSKSKKV